MSKKKSVLLWIISLILMIGAVFFQRLTGPTYPERGSVTIDGKEIKYSLIRSEVTEKDAKINIICDKSITGSIKYKILSAKMDWLTAQMKRNGDTLVAVIPWLEAAGKVQYHVSLFDAAGKEYLLNKEETRVRFKGHVPDVILWPHIIFMFLAFWFSIRTALEAAAKGDNTFKFAIWTLAAMFVGGIVLGPIVQKFAFGAYWTGWPFGDDLTDNKTAFAFISWIIAVWRLKKDNKKMLWPVLAAVISLAMYLIPHSTLGSQLDYSNREIPARYMNTSSTFTEQVQ